MALIIINDRINDTNPQVPLCLQWFFVTMINVNMPTVIMLSVMAPFRIIKILSKTFYIIRIFPERKISGIHTRWDLSIMQSDVISIEYFLSSQNCSNLLAYGNTTLL